MPNVIVGITLLIFSAICFFFAYLMFKRDKDYKKNCKYAKGVVVANLQSGGGWYQPRVTFTDEFGQEQKIVCEPVRMNAEMYNSLLGATVTISYRYKTVLGLPVWEGNLVKENIKTSTWTAGVKGLTIIGAALLLVSIVLIIMGIVG